MKSFAILFTCTYKYNSAFDKFVRKFINCCFAIFQSHLIKRIKRKMVWITFI
ncbi:hypothetical protein [Spiroplasma endosymbiont of Tipula paludosa]|uniref:hypothetical protein n=1 Tax=Spiroplasma endosymbiont of Tipula paludosa TaxID=3066295 RepID=UPI0035C91D68